MEALGTPYVGNGHYCYANAAAMLLAANGEQVSPGQIEVSSGVGLGAVWFVEEDLFFFGLASPDTGITRALGLLGFEIDERAGADRDAPPMAELSEALAAGPVLLGPLDIGLLTYVAGRGSPTGVDHYVLAYAIDAAEVHVHDPAGFPHVSLPLSDLAEAWRAERVGGRRGAFRSWTAPRRMHHPSRRDVAEAAVRAFEEIYAAGDRDASPARMTGSGAIRALARCVRSDDLPDRLSRHMVGFLFQVAARRALDYAAFFEEVVPALADAKRRQAALFGRCHTLAVRRDRRALADVLERVADVEDECRHALRPALSLT